MLRHQCVMSYATTTLVLGTLPCWRILNKELHLNVLEFFSDAHVIDTMRLLTWPDKYQIGLQRARGDRLMAVGGCVYVYMYNIHL